MVSNYTIQQAVQNLENIVSHEEKLYKILEIYLDLFPVKNSYLLRYSPLGFLGEGVFYLSEDEGVHIGEIREDIRSFPIIYSAISEKRAKYCTGLEYLKQVSIKYTIPSNHNSLLVVPIYNDAFVFAYICSSDFKENTTIDNKLLEAFTYYGNLVGKLLGNTQEHQVEKLLSRRELEVLRRISYGESTKEMASTMNISELTINQYVKTAIQKLGAHNRSHAIGELFRRGYIL
ncbi:response regulator transcription factor [Ureibacillus acetophenoni]|uniref:Regulatory LuxR family protein n=1 Tax=Ureibacillus acetophenoni TaxID=614649 RepID=A0A285ULF1_9BACL|nr:LuxR C-terminal-related transcriptional regulator [Ureibacillus acetophenoni]SOC42725.1 regulatory LuxR family protein [Ureibacillus acetophenoni]